MSDSNKALSYEVRDDGVAIVTYDVPGDSVNTLQASFGAELEAVIQALVEQPAVKAAVIVSGKRDTWVAGADIRMLQQADTAEAAEKLSRMGQDGLQRLAALSKPVVAAIHGAALGGGFELALACHGRVLSDSSKTVLGLPEVQLGLLPGSNGLQRLAQKAGLQVAMDYGLTGKNMRPKKAKKLGIAADVVRPSVLLDVAVKLALALAEGGAPAPKKKGSSFNAQALTTLALEKNPVGRHVLFKKAREMTRKKTYGHYPATERILDVLETFAADGFEASAELEARCFGELCMSDVSKQLVGIFNATTALKKDSGVDDPDVQARTVKQVAMLGGGLMGGGICFVTMNKAKLPIRLKERDLDGLARGYKYVNDIYGENQKKKRITKQQRLVATGLLTGCTDYSGFGDVDVVIEAVFEDLDLKHRIIKDVEEV